MAKALEIDESIKDLTVQELSDIICRRSQATYQIKKVIKYGKQ